MTSHNDLTILASRLDNLLISMVTQQRARAFKLAQRLRPNITEDDLGDPHSIPEIIRNPEYAYEDGQLAGLLSAQISLQRELHAALREDELPEGGPGE